MAPVPPVPPCRHYWQLEPQRVVAAAVCRRCGATREFNGGAPPPGRWWLTAPTPTTDLANYGRWFDRIPDA
jgi:hypothetical protein